MEKRINLIPTEMAVPARAVKLTKTINKVSIVSVIILILTSLLLGGAFFYYSLEDKKVAASVASLKSKIVSLEKSEQKLVLAKDRIEKINIVQNAKSVNNEVLKYQKFAELVLNASGSAITEADLSSKGTEVSVLSANTSTLSLILAPLLKLTEYQKIVLTSLNFNPASGYISSLVLGNN